MAGALKNSYVTAPQVIDYGSTENSYKAVATMRKDQGAGVGSSIYALTINEYKAPGSPSSSCKTTKRFSVGANISELWLIAMHADPFCFAMGFAVDWIRCAA